jgi:hypothetical protein
MACRLSCVQFRRICQPMTACFTMDDRTRLPWRFFGAARSVLARA